MACGALAATAQEQVPTPQPAAHGPVATVQNESTGTVSGLVMDSQGSLLVGAHVTLATAQGVSPRELVTDNNGQFLFAAVPAGSLTVNVKQQGFETASASATLEPGKILVLRAFSLHLSSVNVVVNAVAPTERELELEQLHAQEQQRLIGVLPNFFVSYNWYAPRLTTRQKFSLATKNASDPGNLLLVGVVAGVQQATNAFPGYSQGAAGYGKRYGADLANLVVGTYMGGAVLPTVFRQDPRYFYKGSGTLKSRFLYAVSSAIICRGDNGRRQPNVSGVLGDLAAGAISNIYYPASDRQGAALTVENGLLGIAGDAMTDVFQEFVFKKFTPKARDLNPNSAP